MSIHKCSFSLEPLNSQAQQLCINFYDNGNQLLSQKTFEFLKEDPFTESGEIFDIYSQNGVCQDPPLAKLFQKRDVQDAKKILKIFNINEAHGTTILALDLKDPNKKYIDASSITNCEIAVCDFFGQKHPLGISENAKKIHGCFQDKLDFILKEGSLKKDLIHEGGFSDDQIDFLHCNPVDFCQITEFFMNGLKLGFNAPGFSPDKYITPISTASFKPCTKSTIYFPPLYAKLYSCISNGVPGTLQQCFSVSRSFDNPSKVTLLSTELKI